MKHWQYWICSLLILGITACKDELPLPVNEDPELFVKVEINGEAWNKEAGVDDWYLDAEMIPGEEGFREFSGTFRKFDTNERENLSITFNDWEKNFLEAPLTNLAFPVGEILYARQPNPDAEQRTFQFRVISEGKLPFLYEWDFGDGSTSVEAAPLHTFPGDGKFKVHLGIRDGRGCWSFARQEVRVGSEFRECRIAIKEEMLSEGEVNLSAILDEKLLPPSSMMWDFGDGNAAQNQNDINHSYADPGIFEVKLAAHFADKTCVVFKNIFPYPRLSCLSNIEYGPRTPGGELGRVRIHYTNPEGKEFTSAPFQGQPGSSRFWLDEVQAYKENPSGSPTKKLKIRFHARLYHIQNEKEYIDLKNGEAVIAVEVPR